MLFIAVWAMFTLSQAFAACCDPRGEQQPGMAGPPAIVHSADARADAGQGDTDAPCCDDPVTLPCPAAFDEILPPAASAAVVADEGDPARVPAPAPASIVTDRSARPSISREVDYPSLAPPDPIYLRLKRFLI